MFLMVDDSVLSYTYLFPFTRRAGPRSRFPVVNKCRIPSEMRTHQMHHLFRVTRRIRPQRYVLLADFLFLVFLIPHCLLLTSIHLLHLPPNTLFLNGRKLTDPHAGWVGISRYSNTYETKGPIRRTDSNDTGVGEPDDERLNYHFVIYLCGV